MKGLRQRVVTGAIFVLIMMGGIFGGRYPFVLLFALINALCLWEFFGLTLERSKMKRDALRKMLGVIMGMTPFAIVTLLNLEFIRQPDTFLALALLLVFPLIFLFFIYELYTKSAHPFTNIAFILLGIVYIGIPFSLVEILAFKEDTFQTELVFGLLLLTWSNDTGAFLVGSNFGKTPLLPRISPKKTWEGSIGGIAVTLLVAVILYFVLSSISMVSWIVLGIIVSIFGSFGDLIESMLKRSLDRKDSGNMLPGHGGILDRFDAFIFLMPYAVAYLLWIR